MKEAPVQVELTAARRGFTLIELLVVVAIIAILVSILMPSLAAAKIQAKRMGCASQMRNGLLTINLYAEDFQEYPFNANKGVAPVLYTWSGQYYGAPVLPHTRISRARRTPSRSSSCWWWSRSSRSW